MMLSAAERFSCVRLDLLDRLLMFLIAALDLSLYMDILPSHKANDAFFQGSAADPQHHDAHGTRPERYADGIIRKAAADVDNQEPCIINGAILHCIFVQWKRRENPDSIRRSRSHKALRGEQQGFCLCFRP